MGPRSKTKSPKRDSVRQLKLLHNGESLSQTVAYFSFNKRHCSCFVWVVFAQAQTTQRKQQCLHHKNRSSTWPLSLLSFWFLVQDVEHHTKNFPRRRGQVLTPHNKMNVSMVFAHPRKHFLFVFPEACVARIAKFKNANQESGRRYRHATMDVTKRTARLIASVATTQPQDKPTVLA